jgi:mannosyltransferase
MIYLLSLRQPVYTDRYVIWLAPALMILLALGARTILDHAGLLARPLVAILLIYTIGFWLYAGWQQKTMTIKYDLRAGVTYVDERRDRDTLLILQIPHQQWAWQYYTSDFSFALFDEAPARMGHWAEGLWTNGGQSDGEAQAIVAEQMRALTANSAELWLLSSEVEMWDARHLMRAWLDSHGTLIEQAEFHGVQARHYRLTVVD